MNQLIWSLFLLSVSLTISAQDVNFYAETDARQVLAGSYVEVKFTLQNAEGSRFAPPDFSPLEVLSGPNRSSQMSIINGVVSRKMTLSYNLLCKNPGTYKIPPATIFAGGKTYESNELTIEVIKGKQGEVSENTDEDIFVRLEISDTTAYIGQQITVKYVLYARSDVQSFDFINESGFDGFYVRRIRNYRDQPQRVIEEGLEYVKRTLKTMAIFPQQTGTFEFEPANVNLGIPDRQNPPSFFFTTKVRNVRRMTNSGRLTVLSSPVSPPASYSGGIGTFEMRASIDRPTISTDDALTILMTVTGNGDGNFIDPPLQRLPPEFDVYDPNVLSERAVERGDQIIVEKQFEYLAVPLESGTYQIEPEFTYFHPDSVDFIRLHAGPFEVRVLQGGGMIDAEDLKENRPFEMEPIVSGTHFKSKTRHFLFSKTYWFLLAATLMCSFLVIAYKLYINSKMNVDPFEAKKSRARKLAMARLKMAKEAMNSGTERQFFEVINQGLYGYIADKLSISHANLSISNVESFLQEEGVPGEIKDQFLKLIRESQMALYAPKSTNNMSAVYEESVGVIANLESHLN